MQIQSRGHVVLNVRDIDRSEAFCHGTDAPRAAKQPGRIIRRSSRPRVAPPISTRERGPSSRWAFFAVCAVALMSLSR
jgi:hypothetical protein